MFGKLKMGLQWKLILLFSISAVIVFVLLFIMINDQIGGSIIQFSQQRLNYSFSGAQRFFQSRYDRIETSLQNASELPTFRNAFVERDKNYFKQRFDAWSNNWDVDILDAVDPKGVVLARKNNNSSGDRITVNNIIQEAITFNKVVRSTEVLSMEFLQAESEELVEQVTMEIVKGRSQEWAVEKEQVTTALAEIVVVPVSDAQGNVLGAFIACDVLNRDYWFVDQLKEDYEDIVATIFNEDGVRISTSVVVDDKRGIATVISAKVMETILRGEKYQDRATALGTEFLTVYSPMVNNEGQIVGILAIGNPIEVFNAFQQRTRNTIFIFLLIGIIITVVSAYFASRLFINPFNKLLVTMSEVELGNYSVRSDLKTGDEIETLSRGLDSMLDKLVNLIHTEEDRERMQQQIIDLLVHVSNASDGDLTERAEVTADELGSVADAFNVMLEDIAGLIEQVKEAGMQVSSSTNEILASSEQISAGADRQIREINNTTSAVEEMSISMSQVSENSDAAAEAAQISKNTAITGGKSVQEVVEGMNRIRDTVQTTAKKIKSLGDRSLEIGEIINVINEIAAQTNMLALNAAIEAARAGEHGRGFAVVADKVQDLAERSTAATKDIANLIKSIQSETNEAVVAMEEGTREVEEGTKLADSAFQSLLQIENSAVKTSDLVQEISLAAKQQVRGVNGVVDAMENISSVTKQTSKGINQTIETIQHLAQLSDRLQETISNFTIEE